MGSLRHFSMHDLCSLMQHRRITADFKCTESVSRWRILKKCLRHLLVLDSPNFEIPTFFLANPEIKKTEPYQVLNILSWSFRRCNIRAFWLSRFDFNDLLISVIHLTKAEALILRICCRNSFSASFQTMKSGSSSKDSTQDFVLRMAKWSNPGIPSEPSISTDKRARSDFREFLMFFAGVEAGVLSLLQGCSIASKSFSVKTFLWSVLLAIFSMRCKPVSLNQLCAIRRKTPFLLRRCAW